MNILISKSTKKIFEYFVPKSTLCTPKRFGSSYEGDGQMTVTILNQEQDSGLLIDSFSTYGFRLNNGVSIIGPMAIFPRSVLSWRVGTADDICEGSLRLFKLLEPKIDVLVLGLDITDRKIIDRVLLTTKRLHLNAEVLPTDQACSTFNFLNAEGRNVAGAFIPPYTVEITDDDKLASRLNYDSYLEDKGKRF